MGSLVTEFFFFTDKKNLWFIYKTLRSKWMLLRIATTIAAIRSEKRGRITR